MKVRDVMQKSVVSVDESSLVKHVARLIFTGSIYSFPVIKGKKLVGFITEEDIFFGMQDVSEKTQYHRDKLQQVLEKPVKDLMIKNVIFVTPETDLIDAQTIMYKHNFAQIPVVDSKGNLAGIVTRASIFRHVLEEEIPNLEKGQYASFMSENYDQMVDWDTRVDNEFPTLFRVFQRHDVKKIIDLGSWTGEYAIRLAKEGVHVTGLDHNPLMITYANAKKAKLSPELKDRISFKLTDFSNLSDVVKKGSVDGVISVGTSLAYLPQSPSKILKDIHSVTKTGGVLILQLLNLEKVVEKKGRFLNFRIKKSKTKKNGEELFMEYFDKKDESTLVHNVVNFSKDGERWVFTGINSIEISYIKNKGIVKMLKDAGYTDVNVTGTKSEFRGQFGQMSMIKPFDPITSDWLTVIAKA